MSLITQAQLYFPPVNSNTWDTTSPIQLSWCDNRIDSLYQFLDSTDSKAFILLKDGKIVLEKYFNGHDISTDWYWASAGKTLTAFMVGIAQQENFLSISDTSSKYLGSGWTNCTSSQEEAITIWHQLTMTSGLDDNVNDPSCTEDTCLNFLSTPGTRWAYHNAPYTLLNQVVENAVGLSLNWYMHQKLKTPTGMNGLFINLGNDNVYFSTARSMARFGLLMLNGGNWGGNNQIMTDTSFFNASINSSQNINPAYGYLWWLNGKTHLMLPSSQFQFNSKLNTNAPDDLYVALGKNGQSLNVVPSQNIVWLRMGESPYNTPVLANYNNEIWSYINKLNCNSSNINPRI
ncbi:MAG: serine hydrolase [Crocinitomicaceae bacterium]|nr:MAG: serine hydrolase [Crocinitomicaceae bacterium]